MRLALSRADASRRQGDSRGGWALLGRMLMWAMRSVR